MVEILNKIEQEPYHWPVGRTMFQKIAYIATQEGLPTGLDYIKSSYGPFAENLKALITKLANNGLIREEQLGKMFAIKVGATYYDARNAYISNLQQWNEIIDKTTDLFLRLRTTSQSEIVSTVHFAAKSLFDQKKETPTEMDVLNEVKQWKQKRRPKLDEGEVAYTIRNLAALNWLHVKPSPELPIPDNKLNPV